ncbi:ABC transporter permease [Dechloromonas sp. A34]|uniref:ABC transporter permease n=1 Tax=Dechloromonas sp. A34 TaxID=447588 RepID=UPI002248C92E|nr:FtsX-like permease family protein [Dechloromonas sp. A34]
MIALSWRLLGRELRSGELRLLFAALAIAVAAVTAVGFFADRVRQTLEREAQQLMGGDLVLIADHPLPERYVDEARRRGLRMAETLIFPSMVIAGEQAQLADLKAVSPTYPLRGQLSTSMRLGEAGLPVAGGPEPGAVWLDERLATALQVGPNDQVMVGRQHFRVAAILTLEPDRGINFFSLAPRLLMHLDDIPATGLVQFGSRLRYRLLFAGDEKAISRFKSWLKEQLVLGERLEDAENARPEIRNALDRAQRFLGLATLLTVVLSAVSVALAARRYMQRHLDACAIMRCLGLTQGRLISLHGQLFGWLALISAVVGCLSGFAAHFVLVGWLSKMLAISLPMPGWLPLWQGAAVAAVLLFGFALPPLLQLSRVPTLRVLRRELGPPQPFLLGGYLLGFCLLAGLIVVVAGDAKLGGLAIAGFTAALGGFWLLGRLAVSSVARLRGPSSFGWRQGLANLGRHGPSAALQIVALAIGLMAMLLLTVTRAELFDAWQQSLPADAPNRFIINIQPDQRPAIAAMLSAVGVEAELAPMVRARLLRIGEQAINPGSFPDDERAQRLVAREFNLSWRSMLPPGNRVTAGRWFAPGEAGQGLASVEEGLAQTLGIKVGDELLFSIAGVEKTVRVSNLRKLEWDSMRVNFFVLTPPGVIEDVPASYITSFHLPEQNPAFGTQLVARFPNLTVIDISVVIEQFRTVMGQVTRAVQFIFLFTLVAGAIVLYSALFTAFDERRYEMAVMRALGAHRVQLRQAMLVELAIVGGIAGLIAAAGAMLLGQVIAQQVFQIEMRADPWLPAISALGGAVIAMSIGWWAMRRLLQTPPLLALRAAG